MALISWEMTKELGRPSATPTAVTPAAGWDGTTRRATVEWTSLTFVNVTLAPTTEETTKH